MKTKAVLAVVLFGTVLVGLSTEASAQTTVIGGGCPGTAPCTWTPADGPRIGQAYQVCCPDREQCSIPWLVLGTENRMPFPFHPPIACGQPGDVCTLECFPFDAGQGCFSLVIPFDLNLIGICICFQCVCLETNCFSLKGAIKACIQA